MERIKNLFEELNFPGAVRLKKALKNRGIPFTKEQVDDLVRGETVKQLQRAPPPLKGKVVAAYQNVEWQADLIDWTTAPSEEAEPKSRHRTQKGPEQKRKEPGSQEKYILVVQDVFQERFGLKLLLQSSLLRYSRPLSELLSRCEMKEANCLTS